MELDVGVGIEARGSVTDECATVPIAILPDG